MIRALESDDPGTTPFDEARRRQILKQFVADPTYGCGWLIEADHHLAGYVILTIGFSFESIAAGTRTSTSYTFSPSFAIAESAVGPWLS